VIHVDISFFIERGTEIYTFRMSIAKRLHIFRAKTASSRSSALLVAFASTFGLSTLSGSPVSAATLTSGDCFAADWGGYWGIEYGSNDPIGSATIEGTLAGGLTLQWNLTPTSFFEVLLQFHSGSTCSGDPDLVAPEGVCFGFTAAGWNPTPDDSYAYEYGGGNEYPISLVLNETEVMGDYPGQELYIQWAEASPSVGPGTLTMTLSAQNGDGSCPAIGNDDEQGSGGGRGPSIDLDYYIERAAAESSSLPDTL
jgi:hypothetical protein